MIGCGDDATNPAGSGGSGGTAGTGGSGTAGTGGSGTAGTGGSGTACTEGELCCIELCFTGDLAEATRAVCLDEYSDCIAAGALTEAQCVAFANETCTI